MPRSTFLRFPDHPGLDMAPGWTKRVRIIDFRRVLRIVYYVEMCAVRIFGIGKKIGKLRDSRKKYCDVGEATQVIKAEMYEKREKVKKKSFWMRRRMIQDDQKTLATYEITSTYWTRPVNCRQRQRKVKVWRTAQRRRKPTTMSDTLPIRWRRQR